MAEGKFEQLDYGKKVYLLLKYLTMALDEPQPKKWRTDVWGIAAQHGSSLGVEKKDFDLIKGMTIEEVTNIILEEK